MTAVVETQPGARPALHTCVMAADAAERQRRSAAFLARGVARGHRAVHVGGQAARHGLLAALRSHGLDVDRERSRGRLHLRSVADVYLEGGGFDVDRVLRAFVLARDQALRAGHRGLRVVGETDWITAAGLGWEQWLDYEQRVNDLFADGVLAAMCVFDVGLPPGGVLDALARSHPLRESTVAASPSVGENGCLRLSGEIDHFTARHLAVLLDDHRPDAGDLHVDLAELRFIDVAGLRTFVRAAGGMPKGQRLVLHSVRPHTRRVLALLGWDGLDTMVVIDEPRARA